MHDAAAREPERTVVLREAEPADIEAIAGIEEASFPTPWSRALLNSEIRDGEGTYLVVEVAGEVAGYIGLWHIVDEGHICTLAVDPGRRGGGLGELLVLAALRKAAKLGSNEVHLEYRVSNDRAAALYRKLGFDRVGVRHGYYSDTGEDAILARITGLNTPAGRERLDCAWKRWRRERCLQLVAR